MKWNPSKFILIVAGLLLVAGLFTPFLAWRWREYRLTQQVETIQAALESYRQQHGMYPESLTVASIPEHEEIFYQHEPDGTYTLWFGMQLGESVTFRPDDRTLQ